MSLTLNDLQQLSPIGTGSIKDEIYFSGERLLEDSSGKVFKRKDNHSMSIWGRNGNYRMYNKSGAIYLYFPGTNLHTQVEPVDCIISETVSFDGFAPGKKFELRNGQIWEQTEPLYSNCSPGGKVIVRNNKIKIGNWDFYPMVKKIK